MPISMKKYVDIKSGINNIRTATEKELIARIFTNSYLVPKQKVIECESLKEVADVFGNGSTEYAIAEKYFSFVNKYARSPKKISFGRDFSEGFNGYITATQESGTLAEFKALPAGSALSCRYGDMVRYKAPVGGSDFTSCNSLSDVASVIQGWIRTMFASDEVLQTLTVTSDGEKFFVNTGNTDDILLTLDSSVAELMKLTEATGAIVSKGAPTSDYSTIFEYNYQVSNNFATYMFANLNVMTASDIATLGNYVALNHPSEFMFIVPVTSENYATIQDAVANIDGVSLELRGIDENNGLYNFVLPMAITATTDYNKENGTVNYMYTQDDNMSVVVDDDNTAEIYDSLKINYYGRTQQAGQKLAFYQDGVLQGKYQDQSIYVNEIWLKDALTTKYINYMLLTPNWYANKAGQAIGQSLAMDVIQRAKLNGTITTEKEMTEADKVYIYNVTADENAWRQIYQEGFYLATVIEKKTINNQEKFVFNYLLIYSKGDSIKKVEGLDILI